MPVTVPVGLVAARDGARGPGRWRRSCRLRRRGRCRGHHSTLHFIM